MTGVEQAQRAFEDDEEIAPVVIEAGTFDEAEFFEFDVPIAEIIVDEVPDELGGFVIAVLVDGAIDFLCAFVETAEDPAIFDGGGG